jgi:5-methylcytosine-specific restriction endonuclease McrA
MKQLREASKYQVNAQVRDLARDIFALANLPRVCRNCGYDKHVEICHIRSISSFPDDIPIPVVNDLSNLVALCPNCHWEFDHGLLAL